MALSTLSRAQTFLRTNVGFEDVGRGDASWGDYDSDGDLDIAIVGRGDNLVDKAIIYQNNGDGTFSDIGAGLTAMDLASVDWGDYDGDGDLDLVTAGFVSGEGRRVILYKNNGGAFDEVNASFEGGSRGSVEWGDYNQDGFLDLLIVGESFDSGSLVRVAKIYRNEGGATFSDTNSDLTGVLNGQGKWGDYDGDGDLDIVLIGVDENSDERTIIYRNDNGFFTETSQNIDGVSSGGCAWSDYDKDEDLDLAITGTDIFGGAITKVFENESGSFSEQASFLGVTDASISWGDYDGDGDPDLIAGGFAPSVSQLSTKLYRNEGGSSFTDSGEVLEGLNFSSYVWGDFDGDSDLDIAVTGGFIETESYIYINTSSQENEEESYVTTVQDEGRKEFGNTGIIIDFDATPRSGNVGVTLFDGPPSSHNGISESIVSSYRFVITSDAAFNVGDNTTMNFDVSQIPGIGSPQSVVVYQRPGTGMGQFTELPTSYDPGLAEIVAEISSFGEFVLASDDPDNPLPVELAAFAATADAGDVVLTWQTASETNNAGFSVEQQRGSGEWTEVAFVDGAGTTTEAQTYRHRVAQAGYGQHAFRLRQVDFDGTAALSEAVEIAVGLARPYALDAYPNPFRAGMGATVDVAVREAQDVTVAVYDVLGRRVAVLHDGPVEAGTTERLTLTGRGLASGVYLVRVQGERFQAVRRLTLVR
jgi:hypothetical protein